MDYRLFEREDLALYLSWVNQREIWEVDNSAAYQLKTIENFSDHFDHIVSLRESYMMILDGREIGYIGLIREKEKGLTPEFFIVIGEMVNQGQGLGKVAMAWLVKHAQDKGLNTLVATVLGNNVRAIKFYERLGFCHLSEIGEPFERNGSWHRLQTFELKF